ncbi:hypothetical protein HK098_007014 [Nowakowskiella sp. JEL0407]|nr:hypothetical protein HK098_007014 [Nowakowskiella sp. JEL0407]
MFSRFSTVLKSTVSLKYQPRSLKADKLIKRLLFKINRKPTTTTPSPPPPPPLPPLPSASKLSPTPATPNANEEPAVPPTPNIPNLPEDWLTKTDDPEHLKSCRTGNWIESDMLEQSLQATLRENNRILRQLIGFEDEFQGETRSILIPIGGPLLCLEDEFELCLERSKMTGKFAVYDTLNLNARASDYWKYIQYFAFVLERIYEVALPFEILDGVELMDASVGWTDMERLRFITEAIIRPGQIVASSHLELRMEAKGFGELWCLCVPVPDSLLKSDFLE